LWSRINVGCQCTHGLGEVHVVDWCSWRFGCEWPRILFYEERSEKKVKKSGHAKSELPLVAPLLHRVMLSGSLEGSLVWGNKIVYFVSLRQ
jgi:hypothetical protein